jgi:NAD(P)-dependent dehydrogenase (short-subunit alcohol dehydrogenase family)
MSHQNPLFSLANRTILITGAARGLGLSLAAAVLSAGGHVAAIDILPSPSPDFDPLRDLASSAGLTLSYHQCDITSESALETVVSQIAAAAKERDAPLRGAVACAGIQQTKSALDYPGDEVRKILDVNVVGCFLTAKHVARSMVTSGAAGSGSGSIVLVASMSGQIANRGLYCSAYNASKAAVQQMARSLAHEWGVHGIRVNSLSPGYIRTKMTDALLEEKPEYLEKWMAGAMLGRLGVPDDFGAPVVYLLADGSAFQTGSDVRVDGGHCAAA